MKTKKKSNIRSCKDPIIEIRNISKRRVFRYFEIEVIINEHVKQVSRWSREVRVLYVLKWVPWTTANRRSAEKRFSLWIPIEDIV